MRLLFSWRLGHNSAIIPCRGRPETGQTSDVLSSSCQKLGQKLGKHTRVQMNVKFFFVVVADFSQWRSKIGHHFMLILQLFCIWSLKERLSPCPRDANISLDAAAGSAP